MKKIVALLLVAVTAVLLFSACRLGTCDFCGKTAFLSEYSAFGSSIYLCKDCNR